MLEFPEANVMAAQLHETVCKKPIQEVTMNGSPHKFAFYVGEPADYADFLVGRSFDTAASYGGMVELRAGEHRMVFNDGVNLRFHENPSQLPAKHQMLILFTDHTALSASVQMYGGLSGFREGEYENPYREVAIRKPSPLSDAFTEAYFSDILSDVKVQKLSMKAALATEQRIPGVGNGVLQDILWTAGLHPKRKVATLTAQDTTRLYSTLRDLLQQMISAGGRDTEKDLFGHPGRYVSRMSKLHIDEGCPVCVTSICKESYMGGSIYYCPKCQAL